MWVVYDVDALIEAHTVVAGGHGPEYVFTGIHRADRSHLEDESTACAFALQSERNHRRCDLPPLGDLE